MVESSRLEIICVVLGTLAIYVTFMRYCWHAWRNHKGRTQIVICHGLSLVVAAVIVWIQIQAGAFAFEQMCAPGVILDLTFLLAPLFCIVAGLGR